MDEPFQVRIRDLADGAWAELILMSRVTSAGAHQPLGGGADFAKLQVVFLLVRIVEQLHPRGLLGQFRHFAQRLVHENAAAVDRRADRVGRNENSTRRPSPR